MAMTKGYGLVCRQVSHSRPGYGMVPGAVKPFERKTPAAVRRSYSGRRGGFLLPSEVIVGDDQGECPEMGRSSSRSREVST